MSSQTLREARRYEEATEKLLETELRPDFHLAARVGWLNDPNGFSWYQGKYHLFYQYYPYAPYWGPMHWGHAVSEDLLHWEYLPAALAPDSPYDRDGCFSGSAVELEDGKHLLIYTGVLDVPLPEGGKRTIQTQCLATGDGLDYQKYDRNPVLDEKDIPEGASKADFRDPKIWRKKNGTFACIVSSRPADGSGQILLYESEDGFSWKFKKILIENRNRYGKMWECPDFFELDGKQVLLVSPMDMFPKGFEYHNGNGTLCLIGDYDEETDTFTEQYDQAIDYGIDFYASQTLLTPDGRRVMIGWMQNWDTVNFRHPDMKWYGQMSIPRELSVKNGRLYQRPVRELEKLRKEKKEYHDVEIRDTTITLPEIEGRTLDLELKIRCEDPDMLYQKFAVRFAQDDTFHTAVSFRPQEGIVKIDRKFSGSTRAIIHQRRCKVEDSENGELKLRLILDRCSVEVFINDGIQVMTATLYTDLKAQGISFFADGAVKMDLIQYVI
ncbi:MAG: glycoside hydrolase family 32 protein [Blautia sp.]|nr:glycoside hydrolase family 32 protein [Blautia sp.]